MCVYEDKACIIYVFSYFVQLRGNVRVWSYKKHKDQSILLTMCFFSSSFLCHRYMKSTRESKKAKKPKSHCRQDEACLSQDCTDVTVFSHWNIKKLLQKNKKIHFHISDSQLGYWHQHHLSTRFTLVHWTTSFSFFLCMSLNNKMLCLKRVINNFWILYL